MSFLARRATAAAPSLSRAFSVSARREISKITVVGNLAATPEVKATSTGREVVEYAVASSSGPRDNRHTSWFRISAFLEQGPRRDFLTSLPKGATVYVEGDAIMNSYNDSEGKPRTALNIYQRTIEVLRRPAPTEPPT
ncbi:nucleic acid-binding protein, partial [Hypoxylon sp. FL0890]